MAAVQDQAAIDFASSLTQSDIPTKLRCATCSKLAVNAFKLQCCDSSICQDCQATLPEACPVCSHSPLDPDMCKPNKTLRMTIRAFIKNEEKKRAAAAEAAEAAAAAAAVAEQEEASAQSEPSAEQLSAESEGPTKASAEQAQDEGVTSADATDDAIAPEATDPLGQVEETSEQLVNDEATHPQQSGQTFDAEADTVAQSIEGGDPENHESEQKDLQESTEAQQQGQSGQDVSQQNFQNMDWNAANGFNPMMNMANGFNPMMGMMGMPGMNPMSMFGGFGAGGIGMQDMSGMNMGMGFGGGFGGNWNAQQGMGGNFGAGYYPNAGYNQPQMHQGGYANQQFPSHNNYQNQNRSHQRGGFAGRGRGGGAIIGGNAGPSNHQAQQDDTSQPQHLEEGDRRSSRAGIESAEIVAERRNSHSVAPVSQMPGDDTPALEQQPDINVEETNEQVTQGEEQAEAQGLENGDNMEGVQDQESNQIMDSNIEGQNMMDPNAFNPAMMNMGGFNPAMTSMMPFGNQNGFFPQNSFNGGFGGRGRGSYRGRGGFCGRGNFNHNMHGGFNGHMSQPPEDFTVLAGPAEGPPIDAPKGPKAMLEGLPNSGIYSRGGYQGGRNAHPTPTPQPQSLPAQSPQPQRQRSASPARDNKERGRSPSHSRSGSQGRKRKHSVESQDSEARERRRERRRRHEKKYDDEPADSEKKEVTKSDSGDEDSSRRSRRRRGDREKHRSTRDNSRDRDHRRRRSRSRGEKDHRSNADEQASRPKGRRERDRERDKERSDRDRGDRDRKRSRRDRSASANGNKDHYQSSRRSRREEPLPTTGDQGFKIKGSRGNKPFAPPTGPRKDRDSNDTRRHPSLQSVAVAQEPSTTTSSDPYAQEREDRIKERMAKEQQRRESATVSKRGNREDGGRRGSNAGLEAPTGPKNNRKGRKVSYKYEDEEGEEARAERVEREREAARWN
ncbi:hypothetical protein E4T47_04974 [Aureobasidium subglaciale]|nr:hypothetical protein E4T47_04974 [Aureobasidium subglaciale]